MNYIVGDISNTVDKAKDMINTYQQVWHDAIWNKMYTTSDLQVHNAIDFNQAIVDQHIVYSTDGSLSDLQSKLSTVENLMDDLKDPPTKYKEFYNDIVDLYSSLKNYEQKAETPTGSLQSYTNDANNLENELSKKINSIKVQLPN